MHKAMIIPEHWYREKKKVFYALWDICKHWFPLHKDVVCHKSSWDWPSGSEENY